MTGSLLTFPYLLHYLRICYPAHIGSGLTIDLLFLFFLSPSLFLLLSLLPLFLSLFFMCVYVLHCVRLYMHVFGCVGAYMNGYRDMCTYMWKPKVNVRNQLSLLHLIH